MIGIDNDYPKKYALMPIIKKGLQNMPALSSSSEEEWFKNLDIKNKDSEEPVIAYIAMECFLLSQTITYNGKGGRFEQYKIVFSNNIHDFSIKVLPFCNIDGVNTSGLIVRNIFDSLEETKECEQSANHYLIETSGIFLKLEEKLVAQKNAARKIKIIKEQLKINKELAIEKRYNKVLHKQNK